MPIFVFFHVLTMFVAVAMAYGPALLMIAAGTDVRSLRGITAANARLTRWVGPAFILGAVLGVVAIVVHGFNPLAGWLVIAYVLFAATAIMTAVFTNPWQRRVARAVAESREDAASPQLRELLGSPRNRALLALDASIIVALIADMVLKPLPGPIL